MIEGIENYKVGIIGGGKRCKALLHAIYSEPDPDARPEVLAVADMNAGAVGMQYAREKGIFTTTDFRELLTIEDMEIVFELTQDDSLKGLIQQHKPPGVLLVDHYDARALLDKLQIRSKMYEAKTQLCAAKGDPQKAEALLDAFYRFVAQINEQANAYGQKNREDLLASEGTLSQIIDGSTIATFVIDRNHKVTHWNLACERLSGMPAREVLGTDNQWKPFRVEKRPTMADLILDGVDDEELWRLYATRWERSDLIEGAYHSEEFFPNLGPEGTWLLFSAAPIKGPDGTVIGAIETLQDRTKQKQAEAERERNNKELAARVDELRSSRQAMSQIINGSTIPTFVIGQDHKITHWNKALERLSGESADEMIGTDRQWCPFYTEPRPTMADVILDQSGEVQLQDLYGSKWRPSVLVDGGWEAEIFFPHLGDSGKWLWFTAAPIKTPAGKVVGAIETLWDKTEERQAAREQERHTQELATFCSIYATLSGSLSLQDRIQEAIHEAADIFQVDGFCIFLLKPDGQFHLKHSHGYSDNVCFHNRIAGEDSTLVKVAREGRTKIFHELPDSDDKEITLLRQAGLVSLVYFPLFDHEKKTYAVIRIASKQANHFGANEVRALELISNRIGVAIQNSLLEEDIKRRVKFQARLIGSSNDGIVATDEKWGVMIFNPTAESIFGLSKQEVIGRMDARELYPQSVRDAFDAMIKGAVKGGLPWQETTLHTLSGEEIPVRFSGSFLKEKNRMMGTVAFFQDMREIKRLEKELLGAERLAAVGQTVAGMAHCVKNILHGFKGGSYILNQAIEKNNTDKLKAGWEMVQRNISRTSALVQDLLSYSKEREPEVEPCEPNQIVAEVGELMQALAEEHAVKLNQLLDPRIGEVLLDPRSLHRSLMNLVSNAIDACRDDDVPDKEHEVTLSTEREEEDWIAISVADNGSGMTDEVKEKLFTSFFSTKGVQGTGLGLLVTSKLIEESRGTIDVDSQWGRGTTFRLRLPVAEKRDHNVA